jgi:hypothetical protein
MSQNIPAPSDALAQIFSSYPPPASSAALKLHALIWDIALNDTEIGPLHESLKWGEPAYTTPNKSGSTVRIAYKPSLGDEIGLYFICNTHLVDRFRSQFAQDLTFEGNRAIRVSLTGDWPDVPLRRCIAQALRYHIDKKP